MVSDPGLEVTSASKPATKEPTVTDFKYQDR